MQWSDSLEDHSVELKCFQIKKETGITWIHVTLSMWKLNRTVSQNCSHRHFSPRQSSRLEKLLDTEIVIGGSARRSICLVTNVTTARETPRRQVGSKYNLGGSSWIWKDVVLLTTQLSSLTQIWEHAARRCCTSNYLLFLYYIKRYIACIIAEILNTFKYTRVSWGIWRAVHSSASEDLRHGRRSGHQLEVLDGALILQW